MEREEVLPRDLERDGEVWREDEGLPREDWTRPRDGEGVLRLGEGDEDEDTFVLCLRGTELTELRRSKEPFRERSMLAKTR